MDTWDYDEPPVDRPPPRQAQATHGQILREVLAALRAHPRVAWAHQFNSGEFTVEDKDRLGRKSRRRIRCAFCGCPDILGQMRDGRFLAVEIKRGPKDTFRPGQLEFLEQVRNAGGVAFVAYRSGSVSATLG